MKKFFTGVGKAVLYVIGCPFLLVGIALAAVVSLFIFIFQFGKFLFLFFTGRSLFKDYPEDLKAREILAKNCINPDLTLDDSINLYPSDTQSLEDQYSSPVFPSEEHVEDTNIDTQEDEVKEEYHD